MCERFTLHAEVSELIEQFRIDHVLSYHKRREMTPVGSVFAIVAKGGERLMDEFRWGLMPFWASDSVCADGVSIGSKPVYDRMIRKQRCVIPCSAFYGKSLPAEKKGKAKTEEAPYFTSEDGKAFGLAGLYEVWHGHSGGELRACTMLTFPDYQGAPGQRMPVVLSESDVENWLNPTVTDKTVVQSYISPIDLEQFVPRGRMVF